MRSSRTLLIIIVLIVIISMGAYFVLTSLNHSGSDTPVPETATPPAYVDIVVSAQSVIPRGWRFHNGDGAVTVEQWPADSLPASGYFSSAAQLDNMYAAQDIPQGTPILSSMLSEATIAPFPEGRVGYGLPMDVQGGLGWYIQEGDHVDVLAAIQLVNVDPEFQSRLPNNFQALPEITAETAALANSMMLSGIYGRFETLPNGLDAMILPNGDAYPQLIVQLTVQDAIVWHIGAQLTEPTPTPETTATPSQGIVTQTQPAATLAPVPAQRGDTELVSLLVTPQDALVLKYLYEIGADLDLVIRAPGDTAYSLTEAVWSRYILDRYQIPQTGFDLPVAPTPVRTPLQLTPIATPTPAEQ